ncbi:GNAT family N-acetyltransferase [Cellulomonas cellasea]|uniref:GCN5 family acetyltransferase n=2 Tax=Cellulomonas cellasea TaxID=43670 RepID=A0A0A0BA22_9CELL|nr:GNAT family N-acetyltransferase [Cellulomonas cellasea]KGM02998.1 GCN5 family acetyltransferase [Cellulomonas cellasea DSM 20118]GEA88746.1 N-acetyltransferase [Cellulomonas cellasea]
MTAAVARLDEDDWERLAEIRLRALRSDPEAFASSLAREELFREQHWRMRLRSSPWWLVTEEGSEAVGLACLIEEPGSPSTDRHVVALWVAPEARRRGVGTALLDAVEREALGAGAETLSLWVREDNAAALRLYDGLGFEPTGERHPVPGHDGLVELRYVRALVPGSAATA